MNNPEQDDPSDFGQSYGKPSASAWIAALSVAFAVFVLGGFIKTYRQLESLKVESKNEIARLRNSIEKLRGENLSRAELVISPEATRIVPSSRFEQPRQRETLPGVHSAERPDPAPPPARVKPPLGENDDFLTFETDDDKRIPVIKAASGLSSLVAAKDKPSPSPSVDPDAEAGRIRVIAVNNGHKKIMVEGGRDKGIAEGGRLELSRSGRWIGDLRVVAVFDNISACEVLHCTMLPEPGDLVRLPIKPAS